MITKAIRKTGVGLVLLMASAIALSESSQRFENHTADISRTQISLTTSLLPSGERLWTTVNRWTNISGSQIGDLYFAYVGQRVSTDEGTTLHSAAWDDVAGQWTLGDLVVEPTDFSFRAALNSIHPTAAVPAASLLEPDDSVAFYRIGTLAPGAYVDIPIRREASLAINFLTNTVLVPVAAVDEPSAMLMAAVGIGLLGLRRWRVP